MKKIIGIVSLKASALWLDLPKAKRGEMRKELFGIAEVYKEDISIRFLDGDAFSGQYSDIVICETNDIIKYHTLWDKLKDSPVFSKGYYEISDVRFGIENFL